MLTYRATTASDGTHALLDSKGDVVAEYLPDADAIVSALSDITMYQEVKVTAREAFLLDALADFGTKTADRWSVVL